MSTENSGDASSHDANQLSTRDNDEDSLSDEDHNNGEQDEEMMIDHCSNDMGPSQDPRSFMDRFVWCETDVRFFNDTNREVLFIIADEEFKLKQSTKFSINDNDDDDDDTISGLIPLSASTSTSMTQSALKSRCMPLAARSNSSQHFSQERLTYVTALTKDEDGEGRPWTRIHYENKVINCKRTKSLKFLDKHLRIIAYRIAQQQQPIIIGGGSEEIISEDIRMRLALPTQRDGSKKRIHKMGKAASKKRITAMPMKQPDHPKERIIKKGKAVITRRQSKRISLLSNHDSKSERTTKKGAIV